MDKPKTTVNIDTKKLQEDFIKNYALSFICGKDHILEYMTGRACDETRKHTVCIVKESEYEDFLDDYHVNVIPDSMSYFDFIKRTIALAENIDKVPATSTWDTITLKGI